MRVDRLPLLILTPYIGASFLHVRCTRHQKLAPESGVKFMAPVSGACVIGLRANVEKSFQQSWIKMAVALERNRW